MVILEPELIDSGLGMGSFRLLRHGVHRGIRTAEQQNNDLGTLVVVETYQKEYFFDGLASVSEEMIAQVMTDNIVSRKLSALQPAGLDRYFHGGLS